MQRGVASLLKTRDEVIGILAELDSYLATPNLPDRAAWLVDKREQEDELAKLEESFFLHGSLP